MNIAFWSSTGVPLAITLTATPIVGGVSEMQGAGPAAVANGHGVIGTAAITSASVITGMPPTITFGAVEGMIWNVPPCEHWMIAPWLRIGGIAGEYLTPQWRRGLFARQADPRLPGAAGSELRAHGRAHRRAHGRRRDGARTQPPGADNGGRGGPRPRVADGRGGHRLRRRPCGRDGGHRACRP